MWESWSYYGIMPVDIEQWHAEIGSFNGHFLGVIMKLELNLLNIISSLNQVLALICALLFQYISNADTAFYFLTIFFVFALSTVVLKFTVYNLFLCFNFSKHIYIQISIFCCVNTIKILCSIPLLLFTSAFASTWGHRK